MGFEKTRIRVGDAIGLAVRYGEAHRHSVEMVIWGVGTHNQQGLVQPEWIAFRPRLRDLIHPIVQRMNIFGAVFTFEKLLEILVEYFRFAVGNIWAL